MFEWLRRRRAIERQERQRFELNEEHVFKIEQASQANAHPLIVQHRANAVWCEVARDLGVDVKSIEPIPGADRRFVSAIPLPRDDSHGGVLLRPTMTHAAIERMARSAR